jgi:hypothetical protein
MLTGPSAPALEASDPSANANRPEAAALPARRHVRTLLGRWGSGVRECRVSPGYRAPSWHVNRLRPVRSPLRYLTTLRLNMAKALLNGTDESVHRVSLRVGYATLSGFNRHFKRDVGCSPREYRSGGRTRPAVADPGSGE